MVGNYDLAMMWNFGFPLTDFRRIGYDGVSSWRPFWRRRLRTLRPFADTDRLRNPCVRSRLRFLSFASIRIIREYQDNMKKNNKSTRIFSLTFLPNTKYKIQNTKCKRIEVTCTFLYQSKIVSSILYSYASKRYKNYRSLTGNHL